MAERYGLLPSEVLRRATTFDFVIMDMVASYKEYRQRIENGEAPAVDKQTLMDLLKETKSASKQNISGPET
jgi:hypothetical protein